MFDRKEYLRIYQNNWAKKRRLEWIDENGPCKMCGSREKLQVDHINPLDKKLRVSDIWSRKEEIRVNELKKCQVLCLTCHKNKTKLDGSYHKNKPKGSNNVNSKLTEEDVLAIWKLKGILSQRKIASLYQVDHEIIRRIFKKQAWEHVVYES